MNYNKILKDVIFSMAMLVLAYYVASSIMQITLQENNSALIFFVAVVAISRYTDGYIYGIIASLVSAVAINYFFMYPYWKFNLSISGYPIAMLSLVLSSIVISTLTTQMKKQGEQNEKLLKLQAEVRLEAEKERMRGNLLRAVSHDLRTPLTGIYGASSVILSKRDDITKEEMVQFAENIQSDTQWLINMVENLLSVTKVANIDTELRKRDEIMEEIVTEAVAKVRKRFPGVRVNMGMSDEILLVPMDSMLIQQVMINLMENALRHSGDKEKRLDINLYEESRDGKNMAIFELRDYGKGINFENIDMLIENVILNTKLASDATRGSGLGLSVCKSIINAHGGFIEARNAESGGSIFRFGLETKEVLAYE